MTELPDWQRGMALMGEHAPGDLRIIKLDDAGRISAFVIDSSDAWGQILSIGNAELAARLMPGMSWDRRGNVLAVYTFGSGWQGTEPSTSGLGATVQLSPVKAFVDGYSLKLTGGSTINRLAGVHGSVDATVGDRIGVAGRFSLSRKPQYLDFMLLYYDSANVWHGRLRIDFDNQDLLVEIGDAVWATIDADFNLYQNSEAWSNIKLVVDIAAHEYVRVLTPYQAYDCSAHPLWSEVSAEIPHVNWDVTIISDPGDNDWVYIDSVVITAVEPENPT